MECYEDLHEDEDAIEMVMEAYGHCEEDDECWMMCFLENDPCYNWIPCMECVDENYEMDHDDGDRDGDRDGDKGGKGGDRDGEKGGKGDDRDGEKGGDRDGEKGGDGQRDGEKGGDGQRDGEK